MRYFSMFSGIGGFELGIDRAIRYLQYELDRQENLHNSKNKLVKWECVGFSEIDKYAIQIYEKHFKGHKNYGDATRIQPDTIPLFDLLVGGFPCQAFSIAGKRLGFNDTRGTLFFEIARILKAKRPAYCLLENVKGLLSHDNGRTFKVIISTLAELGYDVEWQVLNSKNFGVPQNRERVFIIGYLRGRSRPKVFPIGETISDCSPQEISPSRYTVEKRYQGRGGNSISRRCEQACSNADNRRKRKQPYDPRDFDGCKIRRLTPTECERLQGFPDGWTEGVSDTQRYKCLGNAVTVNVVEEIMKRLLVGVGDK